jgi:hypothetical protein
MSTRESRWLTASTAAFLIEPKARGIVRMLGRFDVDLYAKNSKFRELRNDVASISPAQCEEINDSIALSHLWVLGAYELVRTLSQRLDAPTMSPNEVKERCRSLKHQFERIRMPLAKLEAPKRHHQSDYGVAYPALSAALGLCWKVADGDFISRDQIGTELLEYLEYARFVQREAQQ